MAHGETVELPKLEEIIRLSKLTIPCESGVQVLPDGHELQYKLAYSGGEPVYIFDCALVPDERKGDCQL
jgi:hypothetical protein